MRVLKPSIAALALATALAFGPGPAAADSVFDASAASGLSIALPIAASASVVGSVLTAGAQLTVASVQASAAGTEWVFERASDGARASVTFAGRAADASLAAVGTAVIVTALSTGALLTSADGRTIGFVPNQAGLALLHHQRISR